MPGRSKVVRVTNLPNLRYRERIIAKARKSEIAKQILREFASLAFSLFRGFAMEFDLSWLRRLRAEFSEISRNHFLASAF
jgi:hypothetical protein